MLSGLPEIDMKDWKEHTCYQAGYDSDSEVIKVCKWHFSHNDYVCIDTY